MIRTKQSFGKTPPQIKFQRPFYFVYARNMLAKTFLALEKDENPLDKTLEKTLSD